MKTLKLLFIFGIVLIGGFEVCKSQDIIKIASSIEGIHREEIIEKILEVKSDDASPHFSINVKTETFQGKMIVKDVHLFNYFVSNYNSKFKIDSSYCEFLKGLLIRQDTLYLSDSLFNLNSKFFKKVKIINLYNKETTNKEEFIQKYFYQDGKLKEIENDSLYMFISILDQWNLFLFDFWGDGIPRTQLFDYTSILGTELFFQQMLYESYQKFLSHLDTTQDYIILTSSFLLEWLNTRGFQEIKKRDIISFDKKYIELIDIMIERDLLIFVYTVRSYKQGFSEKSLISTTHYLASYTYKYNPIYRKYFFVSEEFKIEEPLE
jgi:hypothetical protein